MLITDEEILLYIRSTYPGYEKYNFSDLALSIERFFIVIRDIHEVPETLFDFNKDILIRGLKPERQTNAINIINFCDSINAESQGMDESIYNMVLEHNKCYTKAYLRNGSRWVTLHTYNLVTEKIKDLLGNRNPRIFFNVSKYTHLLNANMLNSANIRLSLVGTRSLLELLHTEVRKANYDLVMRPVTTQLSDHGGQTFMKAKYFQNFALTKDLHFDHEFSVFGIIAGLTARKSRGIFGEIEAYYYQFDLIEVLENDYSYLNLKIEVHDGLERPVFVNEKLLAHRVLLKRKNVPCNFSTASIITSKLLNNSIVKKEEDIFDYDNPIELSSLTEVERTSLIESGEGIVVYRIDNTLFDSYSKHDIINPQSMIVVEEGEYYGAPYTLFSVKYSSTSIAPFWRIWEHLFLFSKTAQNDHIQRIKLYDNMMHQYQNALTRAEQAEQALEELQEGNKKIQELNTVLMQKIKEQEFLENLANQQQTILNLTLSKAKSTDLEQTEVEAVTESSSKLKAYKITKRELSIIELLKEGLNPIEIADKLFISERTVTTHITNIYKKVGVSDRLNLLKKIDKLL